MRFILHTNANNCDVADVGRLNRNQAAQRILLTFSFQVTCLPISSDISSKLYAYKPATAAAAAE
jgi:hypothetical protein